VSEIHRKPSREMMGLALLDPSYGPKPFGPGVSDVARAELIAKGAEGKCLIDRRSGETNRYVKSRSKVKGFLRWASK
jgi:hypothetical protein